MLANYLKSSKKAIIETRKRQRLLNKMIKEISSLGGTGMILVGSLAWGKYQAVSKTSDIDIYILGGLSTIHHIIKKSKYLSQDRKLALILSAKFVRYYKQYDIKLFSLKSKLNSFPSTIYFLPTSQFKKICELKTQNKDFHEIFFRNLRPNNYPQKKILQSFDGSQIKYSTKFDPQIKKLYPFYIRKDLFTLVYKKKLYGSIFLSHLLSGEILFDKKGIIKNGMEKIWELAAKESIKEDLVDKMIFLQRKNINYGIINLINRVDQMPFKQKLKFNKKFKNKLNQLLN